MTDYEKLKKEFDFSLLKKNQNDIGVLEKNLNVIIENYAVLKLLIDELSDFKGRLFDKVYPVGSVFISVSSVSPESLFGGTWEQISGRFLIGTGAAEANTTDDWGTLGASDVNCLAGEMGGEAWHTLTTTEMPNHGKHLLTSSSSILSTGNATGAYLSSMSSYGSTGRGWDRPSSGEYYPAGQYVGGGAKHNNMPPYLAVYMWKRTA